MYRYQLVSATRRGFVSDYFSEESNIAINNCCRAIYFSLHVDLATTYTGCVSSYLQCSYRHWSVPTSNWVSRSGAKLPIPVWSLPGNVLDVGLHEPNKPQLRVSQSAEA